MKKYFLIEAQLDSQRMIWRTLLDHRSNLKIENLLAWRFLSRLIPHIRDNHLKVQIRENAR
jgi:hypothetical protein